MAKFVVAGKSDCPFYARAELLADELAIKLPHFSVHKIVLDPGEWEDWLLHTCEQNGWTYTGSSPLVWRELKNRGGKGLLLGGCNDFLEYAKGYYGVTCNKSSDELKLIASENREAKLAHDREEQMHQASIKPFKIAINNANSDISYHILPSICLTNVMKNYDDISYSLYYKHSEEEEESEILENKMNGVVMELQDCAEMQLREVAVTTDINECFLEADLIIILNLAKSIDNNLIEDLKEIASSLKQTIKPSTKILIAGENAVICANIILKFQGGLPKQNIMALTRYEENKVKSVIAKLLEVNSAGIDNLIIWGSSKEFIVDYNSGTASGYNGAIWGSHVPTFTHAVKEVVYDKKFLDKELPQHICNQEIRPTDKVLSFSAALISQLKDIMNKQDKRNGIFSLGVVSEGWYDVPEGLVFSFPVKYTNNGMEVLSSLNLSEKIKDDIKRTATDFDSYCSKLLLWDSNDAVKSEEKSGEQTYSKVFE